MQDRNTESPGDRFAIVQFSRRAMPFRIVDVHVHALP